MDLVVILEPLRKLRQNCLGIGPIMHIHVVALKGLHERLCHAVGAAHWGEAWSQPQADGEVDRVVGSVGAGIVGEPLDWLRVCEGLQSASPWPAA